MNLSIRLDELGGEVAPVPVPLDANREMVLPAVCAALKAALTLSVSGMGEDRWDLPEGSVAGFLLALQPTMDALRSGTPTKLTFPPSDRALDVTWRGDMLWLRAAPSSTWAPSPPTVLVPRKQLLAELEAVIEVLHRAVRRRLGPAWRDQLGFVEWYLRSRGEYVGPGDPEPFQAMWTTEKDDWILRESRDGGVLIIHEPSASVTLIENELTAAAVRSRMRAAGVRVEHEPS